MRFTGYSFGPVRVDGVTYDRGLVIDRGKITDSGIADIAGSGPDTAARMIAGTPACLAPQRVAGAPAAPAGDLYSLGLVACQCLAGRPAVTGTPLAIACAHRDRSLPPPDAVPAEVAGLVAELTAKDPAARPGCAGEVAVRAARLRDALTGGAAGARRPGTAAGSATLAEIPLPGAAMEGPRSSNAERKRGSCFQPRSSRR